MKNMKSVFRGKLLHLGTAMVRLPNGFVTRLEVIKHPGAALVVPFLSKDKVILIRQFRPVVRKYLYELPAGTLNKKESPIACARREIVEETGYSADSLVRLGEIYTVPGYSTERIVIYKAQGLRRREHTPEADEVIETIVMTKPMVRRLFEAGKIIDAKTICALSLCGWL